MTRRMAPCSVIEKYSSLVDNGWVVVMLCATVPRPQNPAAHQENSFVWVLIGRNEEAASDNHLMSRLCGDIWIINRDLGPGHSGGSNNIYLGEDSMTNMARLRKCPHTLAMEAITIIWSWAGLSRYKLKQSGWARGETSSHVGAWLAPPPRQLCIDI